MNRVSLSIFILLLLTLGTFSTIGAHRTSSTTADRTRQASPARIPQLGFDCGLGTNQAVLNGTGFPVAPSESGTFQLLSNCFWIGDISQSGLNSPNGTSDRTIEPLVSEQDETFNTISPKIGGGFTANINLIQNGSISSSINAFDLTVSWNPSMLRAVAIDQGGLLWSALGVFTPVPPSINNTAGTARFEQLITSSPTGLNVTLFRIRFDVIGVGISPLTVGATPGAPCGICNPSQVVFQSKSLNFDSESFYDPNHTLNWSASWAFSPNPLVPGSPVTFTATASCTGCTGALSYRWDVNNDTVTDATTNPATLTLPNPGLTGTTVKLKILDAGISVLNHNVTLVQTLPLTAIVRPTLTSISLTQGGAWNATWIGGSPSYTQAWRFCPGAAAANSICVKPTATFAATLGQTNLQALNPVNATAGAFHFAGAYNDSVTITDAGSASLLGPNKSTFYFLVNVTGTPQVYTVSVGTNSPLNATAGRSITFHVTINYNSAYPVAFRSNLFKYRFMFGDGTVGTLTEVFGLTATITHTYSAAGNYNIEVVPAEAGSSAPCKIQETGFATVTILQNTGFDYSLSINPSQGSVGVGGGTTSALVIVNTLSSNPQQVSLNAPSPTSDVSITFNATLGTPPFSASVTVSALASAHPGTYDIPIIANTTAGLSRVVFYTLNINIPTPTSTVIGVWSSQYSSSNITDTLLVAGSTFQVQINVTGAPAFNGYEFALYFDATYIQVSSWDLKSGLFTNPFVGAQFNGNGTLRLSIVNIGPLITAGSGTLLTITFTVEKAGGISPLTLAAPLTVPSQFAQPPDAFCKNCPAGAPNWTRLVSGSTPLDVRTSDGYFKNSAAAGPVASFTYSPANPQPGNAVTFDASASFDTDNSNAQNHGIYQYIWDFGDRSPSPNVTTTSPFTSHIFGPSSLPSTGFTGNFSIRLIVVDSDNRFEGMKTLLVTIEPPPDELPTASFTFSPKSPVVGENLIFDGSGSLDPDGAIQSYNWNFGDGFVTQSSGTFYFYTYNSPGNYTVTLTVVDTSGLRGAMSLVVHVLARPSHDVGLVSVQAFPQVAFSSQQVILEAGIINTGSNTSTVDLTFYYNGKVAVVEHGLVIPISTSTSYFDVQWDTSGVSAGNYTISGTIFLQGDPTPVDDSLTGGQLMLLPPPVITLTPSSGLLGTLVVVHGSGFLKTQQYYPVELEMTFDNQLLGFFFPQNSSFDFSFDVPVAQAGQHAVHALQVFPLALDVKAVFTVTSSPRPVSLGLSVGTVYFPGDTATIFITTSLSGQFANVQTLQVVLIRPGAANITLSALSIATGVYKATYAIPSTGPVIGTYTITVRAQITGSVDSAGLASFEVKPTWLSSNRGGITAGVALAGLVGLGAFAWRKGYFRKKDEEPTPF